MSKRNCFSLIELLVVIGVIAVLAGLLFPVLQKVQARSRQTACMNNLKQLGIALNSYATTNDGHLPIAKRVGDGPDDPGQIRNILTVKSNDLYHCPSDSKPEYDDKTFFERYGSSYEWQVWANFRLIDKAKFKIQEIKINTPLMNDAEKFHGSLGKNFLYEDGGVSSKLRDSTVE